MKHKRAFVYFVAHIFKMLEPTRQTTCQNWSRTYVRKGKIVFFPKYGAQTFHSHYEKPCISSNTQTTFTMTALTVFPGALGPHIKGLTVHFILTQSIQGTLLAIYFQRLFLHV